MNKIISVQEFDSFYDRHSGRIFSNLEFRKCRFVSSVLSMTRDPRSRSTVRNVNLYQCEEIGCTLDAAIVEEVIVDGLKTSDLFQCWGTVFNHTIIKGNIGRIMISPLIATAMAKPKEQAAFDEANAKYYATVDWALDISEARFSECDIRRVPARLIRRDPDTQVVVTREKALLGEWKKLDLSKTYWATTIQYLASHGDPDMVLVAPKRHSKYQEMLDGLKMLRDAGVAEPD
jgi:hypothetical protein